jgi:hypothetical protein
MCLAGCPYDLIYNTRQTLERLETCPRFTYVPRLVVRTLEERGDQVVVRGEDAQTGAPRELRAARCFVAAGVIPSARIVLESLGWVDRPVRLLDSQYNVLPLLAVRATPGVETEALHTLCQIFLEVDDPKLSRHNIHCQLYTYNTLFKAALGKTAGGLLVRLPLVPKAILGRLMVALCYLHSDDSGGVQLRLERKVGTARGALVAEPERTPKTARVVRGLGRTLLRHAPALGFAAAAPAVHIASPGRGYHSGGTFPMNAHPSDAQTDVLGRLAAWRRVHLVDASIMPTIPSATITYSVMANAHRIASRVMES